MTFKDLIDGYFSVNYKERIGIFKRILNKIGLDSNIFDKSSVDLKNYDTIVKSIYGIECGDKLLQKPFNNLIDVVSSGELEDRDLDMCIENYCSLMNAILKKREQVVTLNKRKY